MLPVPRLVVPFSPLLLPLLTLALLALACNGGGPATTVGPTGRETPTVQPGRSPSPLSTVSPGQTPPKETLTATPLARTPVPTATPAAGTPTLTPIPVVTPVNLAAFLAQYPNRTVASEECPYNPRTAIADCGQQGLYALDPPINGQDISCTPIIADGRPVGLICSSQEPLQTLYYVIQ